MRGHIGVLRSARRAFVMGLALLACSCADDAPEARDTPDEVVSLWPLPSDVGLDAGRRSSDAAIGPARPGSGSPFEASSPGPDAGKDAADDVELDAGSCRDGRLDRGEQCDDGNEDDRDGCNNDCYESARPLWSFATEANIFAQTLAVDRSGAIVVGGHSLRAGGGADLWVNKYSLQGRAAWTGAQTLDVGQDESATAVAFTPSGDVVVMGASQVLGSRAASAVLLMKYAGSDGVKRWTDPVRTMVGEEHIGTTLHVAADERIYALATFRSEGRLDVWLQAFAATGSAVWPNALQVNAGLGEFTGAFWLGTEGSLRAYWAATPSARMELVSADISSADGAITTRHTPLSSMSISNALFFDVDAKGGVVVCANVLMGQKRALWMQMYSFEGAPVWPREVLEAREDSLSCADVALDRDGNVAVAGSSGKSERVWLQLYAPDGQPRWRAPVVYDGGYQAHPAGVGFDPDGNVIAAGVRRTVENYSFLWLAKYAR